MDKEELPPPSEIITAKDLHKYEILSDLSLACDLEYFERKEPKLFAELEANAVKQKVKLRSLLRKHPRIQQLNEELNQLRIKDYKRIKKKHRNAFVVIELPE